MRLLAIDLGYSSVKVAYYSETGVLQYEKFISAIAKIDKPMEMDDDVMFMLGTDYYVLGTSALKVPRSCLLKLENYEDLKEAYPVWISYLLKKYGGFDKFDKVVIGLSMAFSDKADELLDHLYNTLMIQQDDYFICLPQGLSCKLTYADRGLDIREISRKNDFRMRNYLILDGGYLTTDFCSVINSSAAAGAAIGIPNTGVICISYDVIDYLFKTYEMKLSVKEAQTIVDNGGRFTRRGREYNISSKLDEFIKNYLKNILTLVEDKYGESLDSLEGLVILGGLSYFFKKYITDPDIIKEIEKHFPTSFLHFPQDDGEYYNAVSYLRAAEKLLGLEEK